MLILKGLVGGLFQVVLLGGLLVLPAGLMPRGTWYWDRALIFLGVYGVNVMGSIVALGVLAPDSLAARTRVPASKAQPMADRIITAVLMVWFLAWCVFIPVDVFSLRLLPPPSPAVSGFGGVTLLIGFAIVIVAIYQNAFALPTVEDQTERGQTLVDTGLYRVVRHPLYLGMLLFFAGLALWLESYGGLVAVSVLLAVLLARTVVEEKTLKRTLRGYTEYMETVRYRLLPPIW